MASSGKRLLNCLKGRPLNNLKIGGGKMRVHNSTTFIAGMVLMLAATLAHGQSYSVVGGSLLVPIPGDDILNPGPIPVLPGAGAGVGVGLEVDAFSYGYTTDFGITDIQFSIDPASVGLPGTAAFWRSPTPWCCGSLSWPLLSLSGACARLLVRYSSPTCCGSVSHPY